MLNDNNYPQPKIRVVDGLEWYLIENCPTNPVGKYRYSNGKSRFSGERETILLDEVKL